jgi:hypothetical protein
MICLLSQLLVFHFSFTYDSILVITDKKKRCCICLTNALAVGCFLCVAGTLAVFFATSIYSYPIHASCRVQWYDFIIFSMTLVLILDLNIAGLLGNLVMK